MYDNKWDVLDPPRSKLRALASKLDGQISELGAVAEGAAAIERVAAVMASWRELANALDFGSEPVLRSCPNCHRRIPTEATRCRYCMATSPHEVAP